MRRQVIYIAVALISITLSGCLQLTKFNHQPTMAGSKAQQFADTAFVERNLLVAYDLPSQAMRNQLSLEQFKALVSKMHPSEYPSFVEATEYEPLMVREV